jgi:hypothetical protein
MEELLAFWSINGIARFQIFGNTLYQKTKMKHIETSTAQLYHKKSISFIFRSNSNMKQLIQLGKEFLVVYCLFASLKNNTTTKKSSPYSNCRDFISLFPQFVTFASHLNTESVSVIGAAIW